jgi:hypothetical protein
MRGQLQYWRSFAAFAAIVAFVAATFPYVKIAHGQEASVIDGGTIPHRPDLASVIEYIAIEDETDQSASSAVRIVATALAQGLPFLARGPLSSYRQALPSHKPCAGPQTGPPTS